MRNISPSDLIPMDMFVGCEPIQVDLVYANENHPRNIFGEALYQAQSKLWAYKAMAVITLLAARILYRKTNYIFELKDCLRTTDAQAAMAKTHIVKNNPDWLEEPNRMVSPPGSGAHPRGMAIDVCLLDPDGREIDMGTPFDDMSLESYRSCEALSKGVLRNRRLLEDAFMVSAKALGVDFVPLPAEWWDFRFPASIYSQYRPLSDKDLPSQMQMTCKIKNTISDVEDAQLKILANTIISLVDKHHKNL